MMPKKRVVFTIVIWGLAWFLFSAGHCPAGQGKFPQAMVKAPHTQAGTVVEGTDIRHTFLLQNRGNAPLIISRAETDCSCTQILHDDVVLPGRNSYLRSVFRTWGRTGDQVKTIRLFTNDPEQPELLLTMQAEVMPAVVVKPNRVFFNGVPGQEMNQSVVIRAPEGHPLELSFKQRQLSDQTGVALKKNDKENTYTVLFRHKGESVETFRGRVLLSTNLPYQPVIRIPVFVRLLPDISVFPSCIDFGRMKLARYQGKEKSNGPVKTLNIKFNDTVSSVQSLSLAERNDRFKTDITDIESIRSIRIKITALPEKFGKGTYASRLDIGLGSPANKTLSVPVRLEFY